MTHTVTVRPGRGALRVDQDAIDVHPLLRRAMFKLGVSSIDIKPDVPFRDRSYEMATVMAALGRDGVYAGAIADVTGTHITFCDVLHVQEKRRHERSLITARDVKKVRIIQP
jgi:hypothetical protein